jgi:serine/threonine-protein kinase
MTPERWREVDAILKAALECEADRRDAFIANACGDDDGLRSEIASLLAAHDASDDEFLEGVAAEAIGVVSQRESVATRLATALAGRYAIEREVAHGGMATVYLARDLRHDRPVAIKVLREELAAAVGAERFLAEIRVTASLQHPHILPLFDSGSVPAERDGQPSLLYYVMPFVEGETLRSRIAREGRLRVDDAIEVAREMAEALEHAHQHGVVHRDVKPENVLLQGGHALVADFGIALAVQHAGGERLTRTGLTVGTPQYMAPEQASGDRAIDARADVYALGVVLHEMLAGESPFAAGSPHAILRRVLHESASALVTRRADVPPTVDAAVQRAMAKRPDDRFASAAAFAEALVVSPTSHETPPSLGPVQPDSSGDQGSVAPVAKSRGRTVSARGALYAILFTLVLGVVGGWVLAHSSLWKQWTSTPPAPSWPPAPVAVVDQSPTAQGDMSLAIVDRAGRTQRAITAVRPWTPRFSPDGRRIAYGAFGQGRTTSDVWLMNLDDGSTQRLTDDDADSNDPQWSPDGTTIAYSANAPGGKDLVAYRIRGGARVLASRDGTQFPSDWLTDGSALLVTDDGSGSRDVIVQPANGSAAWPYAATGANEAAARISRDGRWLAYVSDESGKDEVYLDSYPRASRRVQISLGGGRDPVWRADGQELYYWSGDDLVAVHLRPAWTGAPPSVGQRTVLFRAKYQIGLNTMYDVSGDGQRFAIVQHP